MATLQKYFIDPSRSGGQPVSELYDTINYLSGMTSSGPSTTTNIVVESPQTFKNTVSFNGNTTFTGSNNFQGNSTFSGPITASGSITLNGNTTLSSGHSFKVQGEIISTGTNSFSGVNTFSGNTLNINSGINLSGTSTVNGAINFRSTIDTSGTSNFNGVQNLKGSSTYIGSTSVTFASQPTFSSGLISNADSEFKKNLKANSLSVINNLTCGGNITGSQVYGAVFNDYAEFFPRSEDTEPGDIIALDIEKDFECYKLATSKDKLLVGVHSNSFSHLIGGEIPPAGEDYVKYNLKKFIPVGLAGRVKVKVIGPIEKGDKITASDFPGIGRKAREGEQSIGFALENYFEKNETMINMKIL